MSRNSCSFNSYNNSNPYIVVGCEAVTMNNRRNEQLKHKAEYEKEYQKRPEIKERMKEYMRLYRARKKITRYNQMIVAIVGTLTVIIRNNIKRR